MQERTLEALEMQWSARGFSLSELNVQADGTLSASDRRVGLRSESLSSDSRPDRSKRDLVDEPLIFLGETLGQGGQGIVSLANQVTVRRDVAVKRVTDPTCDRALANLLKEAWVGGHLEHPNLVPVHALARFEEQPAVVMKRIAGTLWRDAIRSSDHPDPLGQHLSVLLSVCDAIAFAHERGVLHLDLKPENVMLGELDEVYVLDWGLAAGFGDEAPEWLPPARGIKAIAGTPSYMAPELAMGAGDAIDPRTDVYLLGAILHEIVTGAAPHSGDTPHQKLFQAYLSTPHDFAETVPRELVSILHRAMHQSPDERFDSVRAFREAIEQFETHRGASSFIAEAEAQLQSIEEMLSETVAAPDPIQLLLGLGACRFALSEARAIYADHPDLAGLNGRLFERMTVFALDSGRFELAEKYMSELETPSEELAERLRALRSRAREEEARVEKLEELGRAEDLHLGSEYRRRLSIGLGLLFFVVNGTMSLAESAGLVPRLGYEQMLWTGVATFAVLGPYGLWRGKLLFRNRANASLFLICIAAFFNVQGLWLTGMALDLSFRTTLALTPLHYLLTFGAVAVLVSRRFIWSMLVQLPTVILGALYPEHIYWIIGAGGGLGAALIGITWKPTGPKGDGGS